MDWQNWGRGPKGGSNGARGAIVVDGDSKRDSIALNQDVKFEDV